MKCNSGFRGVSSEERVLQRSMCVYFFIRQLSIVDDFFLGGTAVNPRNLRNIIRENLRSDEIHSSFVSGGDRNTYTHLTCTLLRGSVKNRFLKQHCTRCKTRSATHIHVALSRSKRRYLVNTSLLLSLPSRHPGALKLEKKGGEGEERRGRCFLFPKIFSLHYCLKTWEQSGNENRERKTNPVGSGLFFLILKRGIFFKKKKTERTE